MSRFEPYIVIHSLGGPVQGDDKAAYADFLNFLLQQGVSFYSGKFSNDATRILQENFEERTGRSLFGSAYTAPFLTFPNLPVRGAELWLGTWNKEQTRSVRMNIFGNDGITTKEQLKAVIEQTIATGRKGFYSYWRNGRYEDQLWFYDEARNIFIAVREEKGVWQVQTAFTLWQGLEQHLKTLRWPFEVK